MVYPAIDFQDMVYYAAPKQKKVLNSLDEVDPELLKTFEKLGISLDEQKRLSGVAVDANQTQRAAASARKRQRPLTAGQEALFFGVTFAVAVALQLVVVLKVADIISW